LFSSCFCDILPLFFCCCSIRTASDLEELGFIDKKQKGLIKDLIISGDTTLQALLDKYERGDGKELLGKEE
jgi:hypothetical protein